MLASIKWHNCTKYVIFGSLLLTVVLISIHSTFYLSSNIVHNEADRRNNVVKHLYKANQPNAFDGNDSGYSDKRKPMNRSLNSISTHEETDVLEDDFKENYPTDSVLPTSNSTLKQRLPHAIIIGMSKAGTRALGDYLGLHSGIKATVREVHFFDRDGNYSKGYEWYKSQLPFTEEGQLTIERTPMYVVYNKVPERIYKMNSSVKLILVVKEPLTRAVSEYVHNCADSAKYCQKTFEQYAILPETGEVNTGYKPLTKSIYFRHMPRWYKYFSQDQIFIVDGDDLVVNPLRELKKLEMFLGVKPELTEKNLYFNEKKGFYCMKKGDNDIPKCLGENKGRPHPSIKPEVAAKIHDFFRPWNEKFFQKIGLRFSWP